jgi:uncharacterized protein YerC
MSTPVTRGELLEVLEQVLAPLATKAEIATLATKAEIAPLATKAEIATLATKAEIATLATKAEIATLATRTELEIWGGALLARIERVERMEQRLGAEMARQFGAFHEAMVALFSAGDEKYATLPDRVRRLETAVFAPK